MNTPISFTRRRLALIGTCLLVAGGIKAHAEELLFTETWSDLGVSQTLLDSGRWSMGLGPVDRFVISEGPASETSKVFLAPLAGDETSIVFSIERITLNEQGLQLSVEIARAPDHEGQFQFGLRKADAGAGAVQASYYVRVLADEVFLNKFPAKGDGPNKLLKSYPFAPGEFAAGSVHTFALRVQPISATENQLQLFLDDQLLFTTTDRNTLGVPAMDESVRVLLGADAEAQGFIGEIKVSH